MFGTLVVCVVARCAGGGGGGRDDAVMQAASNPLFIDGRLVTNRTAVDSIRPSYFLIENRKPRCDQAEEDVGISASQGQQ